MMPDGRLRIVSVSGGRARRWPIKDRCADGKWFWVVIWYLYMVRGKDRKIYTGISTNVSRRLDEHRGSGAKGAKFLRGRSPLDLLIVMSVGSRGDALRVERRVKRLPRARKEDIIREPAILASLIESEIAIKARKAPGHG
jgi:putative endonuclease